MRKGMNLYRALFVFVFASSVTALCGLYLEWTLATERYELFAGYFVVIGAIIWKFWDYRDWS
jgi:hypothetical protein